MRLAAILIAIGIAAAASVVLPRPRHPRVARRRFSTPEGELFARLMASSRG
jgi:hypothetical protein